MRKFAVATLAALLCTFAASAASLVDCTTGVTPTAGDFSDKGFYVPSYPGTTLDQVTLALQAASTFSGTYNLQLVARDGAFNGPVIGTATASPTLSTSSTSIVSFTFPSSAVTATHTVTFDLTVSSGPFSLVLFSVTSSAGCTVVETTDKTPPLGTAVNRVGMYIAITGTVPVELQSFSAE